jgi:MGT family glycosyltransferase
MLGLFGAALLHDFGAGVQAGRCARSLGQRYGVPPLGMATILNAPGDLAISYTSTYFQPYADKVADTVRFVGWTLRTDPPGTAFPPTELALPAATGRRLIYVSLGSLVAADAAFFRTCIDAFAGADEYVLISTGRRFGAAEFGALPPNVAVQPWVPQAAVLQQAALFITHAGLGSVHDGLYCGVPLLLAPQQEEQRLTARRVVELGAGLTLKKSQVDVATIRGLAARLLTEPSFAQAAQRIGETLRAAGGAARGADEVETTLRQFGAGPGWHK